MSIPGNGQFIYDDNGRVGFGGFSAPTGGVYAALSPLFSDKGNGLGTQAVYIDGSLSTSPGALSVGSQNNAWNASGVVSGGLSNSVDVTKYKFVTAFGNASASTTIYLQFSQDGVTFYSGPSITLGSASDFFFEDTVGCNYVRLKSSNAATISATIAAKA